MRRALAALLIVGCSSPAASPARPEPIAVPAAPAPAPVGAPRAAAAADASVAAAPEALGDRVAVIFASEIHVLTKDALVDAEPRVIALPKPVERRAMWSGTGELYVPLQGGDIAVLDGENLRPLALPRQAKRKAHATDRLWAGKDGSMWLRQRTQWVRLDGDRPRLDSRGSTMPRDLAYVPLPAPPGFTTQTTAQGYVRCTFGPPDSPYKLGDEHLYVPLGGAMGVAFNGLYWVTHDPPRLVVAYSGMEPTAPAPSSGGTGGTCNCELSSVGPVRYRLWIGCKGPGIPSALERGDGELDAFADATGWHLVRHGRVVRSFPGARAVALGGARGGASWD